MNNAITGVVLVACAAIFTIILISEKECEASGGKYLRGLLSFECVVIK